MTQDHSGELTILYVLMGIFLICFFIPTYVARKRKHTNTFLVFLANLFLGWTGIGWFCVLAYAMFGPKKITEEEWIRERAYELKLEESAKYLAKQQRPFV